MYRRTIGLLAASLLSACGCGGSGVDRGEVFVHFNHTVAGADLKHEEIVYTNAAGNQYGITRLEYIVSDIALETKGGKRVELTEFHYRNAFVAATRSVLAKVPGDDYTALHFTFGIDGAKNQTGALPSVDYFNNMAWPTPMGGGYHYMRMEGLFHTTNGEGSFLTHTGPSGGADFSFDIALPLSLSVDGDQWDINVIMNIDEWYDNPSVYDFEDRGGIMGNADVQSTLLDNGLTVFSLGRVGEHDHASHVSGGEEVHSDDGEQNHEEHLDG